MAKPTLTPSSQSSKSILPSTGSTSTTDDGAGNSSNYPLALYVKTTDDFGATSNFYDRNFVSGAADQVTFTHKLLGGDVLDIELSVASVYTAYESAVLEYSYIVNLHQSKNTLTKVLGQTTGAFDHDGTISGSGDSLYGKNIALKYPRFKFTYATRVAEGVSEEAGFGGTQTTYSASFDVKTKQQIYDLQNIISGSSVGNPTSEPANSDPVPYEGKIKGNKIKIRRVYYKTPQAMWRFFGYYGGLNVVGNMSTYGQFSDDSTFEVIPAWQNKLQAMAYEDHIYTRISHYSYEIHNNKLKLYPTPEGELVKNMWVEFTVERDSWDEEDSGIRKTGIDGVNNLNTIPFENIPYSSINSIGKQWIRKYALALSKETLGQIRSKFGTIPIPGESVTLNGTALITEANAEKKALKDELIGILDQLTYAAALKTDAEMFESVKNMQKDIPLPVFVG